MPTVLMPDGKKVKFPDDMTQEQIQDIIETELYPKAPETKDMRTGGIQISDILPSGRQWLEQAPVAGAMVGGRVGSVGGPKGAMIGSGVGGATGQALENILANVLYGEKQTFGEGMKSVLSSGLTAGIGEGAGQKVVDVGRKVMAPFASKMTPQAVEVAEQTAKRGIPMSPSSINPTKTARAFESVGNVLFPGKSWTVHKQRQLGDVLAQSADDIMRAAPVKGADKYDVGASLGEAVTQKGMALRESTKAAYKEWNKNMGDKPVNMAKTSKVLEDFLSSRNIKDKSIRDFVEEYAAEGSQWSPKLVDQYQNKISTKTFDKMRGLYDDLQKALKSDLGDDMFGLLQSARDASKLERVFRSNRSVKGILQNYHTSPEKAVTNLFRSGNLKDVNMLKKELDKETWDVARSRFLENLMDASMDYSGQTKVFKPGKFIQLFDTYKRQIENVFPESFKEISDFANLNKFAIGDVGKRGMSEMAQGWQLGTVGGFLGAVGTGNFGYTVPYGFSWMMAKSLMNPSGLLKQWLTTGISAPMTEEATKQAVKAGTMKIAPDMFQK